MGDTRPGRAACHLDVAGNVCGVGATEDLSRRVIGRRIGSAFIDLILFWGAFWAVFVAMANSAPSGTQISGSPNLNLNLGDTIYYLTGSGASGYLLAWVALAFLWFGLLPGLTGWTPGKLITGLRVVSEDGSGAGVPRNMLRALCWLVDGFPYFLPGLVGFVLLLANKGRRVADLLAHSAVVAAGDVGRAVSPEGGAPAAAPVQPAAGWYPDPGGGEGRRWWDGTAWSDHRA